MMLIYMLVMMLLLNAIPPTHLDQDMLGHYRQAQRAMRQINLEEMQSTDLVTHLTRAMVAVKFLCDLGGLSGSVRYARRSAICGQDLWAA